MESLQMFTSALVAVIGVWVVVGIFTMTVIQTLLFHKEYPVAFMGLLKFNGISMVSGILFSFMLSGVTLALLGLSEYANAVEVMVSLFTVALVWTAGVITVIVVTDMILKWGRNRRTSKLITKLTEPTNVTIPEGVTL